MVQVICSRDFKWCGRPLLEAVIVKNTGEVLMPWNNESPTDLRRGPIFNPEPSISPLAEKTLKCKAVAGGESKGEERIFQANRH